MTTENDYSHINTIISLLPSHISGALSRLSKSVLDKTEEIRLRSNAVATVTVSGECCVLCESGMTKKSTNPLTTSAEDIEDFIYRFCKGSVYSYEASLSDFYITIGSVRVGISGQAIIKNGVISGVGSIYSVNIRIPRHIDGCARNVVEHIARYGFPDGKGILIASAPGQGKTTLLRDLAKSLSLCTGKSELTPIYKVCVIDERNEIYMDNVFCFCCADFLTATGKVKGIEIASRVLSPQIIVCDEIGSAEEAEKIRLQKNSGTVFIASVHADSIEAIMKKEYLKRMYDEGVFGYTYLLSRKNGTFSGIMTEYQDKNA